MKKKTTVKKFRMPRATINNYFNGKVDIENKTIIFNTKIARLTPGKARAMNDWLNRAVTYLEHQ